MLRRSFTENHVFTRKPFSAFLMKGVGMEKRCQNDSSIKLRGRESWGNGNLTRNTGSFSQVFRTSLH